MSTAPTLCYYMSLFFFPTVIMFFSYNFLGALNYFKIAVYFILTAISCPFYSLHFPCCISL